MKHSLIWFRNNLRISDSNVLKEACKNADLVIAAYCFNPANFETDDYGIKKTGRYRAKFLLESVENLKENLKELQIPLFVFQEAPEDCLPTLIEICNISRLYLQMEWTPEEVDELDAVKQKCNDSLKIESIYDQFLFHPDDAPFTDFKDVPEIFSEFRKKCEKLTSVRSVVSLEKNFSSQPLNIDIEPMPTLSSLGFEYFETDERTAFPFMGGESQALNRLNDYIWNTQSIRDYKETRNGLIGPEYSSKLSPWLANGCISPRTIYREILEYEEKVLKNESTYWLFFELIWRDFFKYVSLKHGTSIFASGGIQGKEVNWKDSRETFLSWKEGKTNSTFINANMNELAATGWMSNRGRQNAASFWAKELKQDWRLGARYFESMLLDYDVHSNWGNWMYLAGVGNDPRDRKFNIERQSDIYDGDLTYRKLWAS